MTGKMLDLPVYSIDRLFFEALVSNSTPAAQQINALIDQKFMSIASETDLLDYPEEDAFDSLEKKVALILSGKEKKPKSKEKKGSAKSSASVKSKKSSKGSAKEKKSSKSGSSKGSKKEKKEKKKKEPEVFMNLQTDLIKEVLQCKLKEFRIGIVMESLNSSILRKPSIALSVVLNSLGNVRHIQFFLFSYTYEDYCAFRNNVQQLQNFKNEQDIKNILDIINEIGADDYLKLSPEFLNIYRERVLRERKLKTALKREALK